ncbi:ribbon-helix-helix domain-containing protein [Halobium salinum]|uniref:Ribbon-helix-helix domain-containing protein n=1 Tax=Halobium salinum TaxID=1364940 RepID=A0ABD5PH67_9EURY|nr:ribbon-helix-helix domain-containing protein [Halobium salinum]
MNYASVSVKFPVALDTEIERFLDETGIYTNKSEFIKEACRAHLRDPMTTRQSLRFGLSTCWHRPSRAASPRVKSTPSLLRSARTSIRGISNELSRRHVRKPPIKCTGRMREGL